MRRRKQVGRIVPAGRVGAAASSVVLAGPSALRLVQSSARHGSWCGRPGIPGAPRPARPPALHVLEKSSFGSHFLETSSTLRGTGHFSTEDSGRHSRGPRLGRGTWRGAGDLERGLRLCASPGLPAEGCPAPCRAWLLVLTLSWASLGGGRPGRGEAGRPGMGREVGVRPGREVGAARAQQD